MDEKISNSFLCVVVHHKIQLYAYPYYLCLLAIHNGTTPVASIILYGVVLTKMQVSLYHNICEHSGCVVGSNALLCHCFYKLCNNEYNLFQNVTLLLIH